MNNLAPSSLGGGGNVLNGTAGDAVDWWFTALDQRTLSVGAERWIAQVTGIHLHGSDFWIQLELLGEQLRSYVVRVSPGMSVDDVLAAVEALARHALRHSL